MEKLWYKSSSLLRNRCTVNSKRNTSYCYSAYKNCNAKVVAISMLAIDMLLAGILVACK